MMRLTLIAASLAATAATNATTNAAAMRAKYEPIVRGLWNQSDTNNDGALSLTEFTAAHKKLGIPAATYTNHGRSYSGLFNFLDRDNSTTLTVPEMTAMMSPDGLTSADKASLTPYITPLIGAFTNGATAAPTLTSFMPTSAMNAAPATVKTSTKVSTPPDQIYAGTRAEIKTYYATTANVPTTSILMTYLPANSRRQLHGRSLAAGGTVITATIYASSQANADAARAALPTTVSQISAVPAFSGLTPTAVTAATTTVAIGAGELPFATAGIAGAAFAFGCVFLCCNACFWSGRKLKKKKANGDTYTPGCCGSGCCSFNAVPSWAFGELAAAGAVLGTVFYLYTSITPLTDAIVALVTAVLNLTSGSLPATVSSFTANLNQIQPVLDQLRANLELLKLLPLAVVAPGALAGGFLLLAAICPVMPANKGSFCFTKVLIVFAKIMLIVSLVLYSIFSVFGIVVKYAPPIRAGLGTVSGMCTTIPANLQQRIIDGTAALNRIGCTDASNCPANMATAPQALSDASRLSTALISSCGAINALFVSLNDLFLPGLFCVCALCFALFVNQTLCCAAGCCGGPNKKPKTAAKDKDVDAVQSL